MSGALEQALVSTLAVVEPPALADGPWWAALVPLLPLLASALTGLCAAFGVRSKLPAWISVGSLAASFVVAVMVYFQLQAAAATVPDLPHGASTALHTVIYQWFDLSWGTQPGQHFTANFGFYMDGLTVLWMLFVTGLATLIALYASEYMAGDLGVGYCRFFAGFNLFVFSMACLVMADNLVLLYLGWEGVGLCSYLLIGYFYKKPSAVAAAKKAFIVNRIGDLGLALAIWLIFVKFGTVEYAALFSHETFQLYLGWARDGFHDKIPADVQLIPFLLMLGAFGKSAQFPLYVWLPDAMEGPTPVSALIHAATMVTAGVFLIARTLWVFELSPYALPTVAWIGGFTALLAATIGMAQFDIKRIMAYSTVSQLGFMFAGLGFLTSVGAASHVFTHAFFKALLFLACGAVMHGFAGQLDLRKLSGVARIPGWRIVGFTMLIGCLNLSGFPIVTSGFWSKDTIMAEAFVAHGPGFQALGILLVLTAGLTAYYTFRVFFRVFVGPVHYEPGDELHGHDAHAHDAHHDLPHEEKEERAIESELAAKAAAAEHPGEHGFHPHPPGWAINTVLVILALGTFAAIPLVLFPADTHGWVGGMVESSTAAVETHAHDAHGFWSDPHQWMLAVSTVIGLIGIALAWWLHYAGRTSAARSRADALVPALGPIAGWARNKWYVDELYDLLFVKPLWALSHLFYYFDALVVDGLVGLAGWLPRATGRILRPAQSGQLHGYAVGMAGGIGLLIVIVLLVTKAAATT
ncbi:MAG: NADH-quinone oxidoreductase subunit L [Phycisphaerales bacterium]